MHSNEVRAILHEAREHQDDLLIARDYAKSGSRILSGQRNLRAVVGKDFRFNYCRAAIKAWKSRLRLTGVACPDQTAVDEFVNSSKFIQQFRDYIDSLCAYGEAYMIMWPESDRMTATTLSPLGTAVVYDDGTGTGVRWWNDGDLLRVNLYTDIERLQYVSKDGKEFVPYSDELTDSVSTHDVGIMPILHSSMGGKSHGKPVHYEIYGVQDTIVELVGSHRSAIRFYGWPQAYALYQLGSASGSSELGELMGADTGISENATDEVRRLRRDPGTIWGLHARELGTLQAAESKQFLESLREYRDAASVLSGIPASYFSAPGGQHPSGDSQRAAKEEFEEAVRDERDELDDVIRTAVAVGSGVDASAVTPLWARSPVESDSDWWQSVVTRQEAGVPVDQTLVESGYSQDDVDRFNESAGADLALLRQVQVLDKLGDALAKLAAAREIGAIDDAQLSALVNRISGDISGSAS